jgi:voltage-gated potassium channel
MLWTVVVIIGGLIAGTVAMSMIVAMIVEGQMRIIFGRRQLQRRIASLSGHVIVCGYGRMGGLVADELVRAGKQVVIIDNDDVQTRAAEAASLLYVLGSAEADEVLIAAGVARAAIVVTTLATDADNVFVTLSAREINPNLRIIAVARDTSTQDKLIRAGANRVVCAHTLGASRMAAVVLRPAVVDFVEMAGQGGEIEMDQVKLADGSRLAGKSLKELQLPHRVGVHVCAVQRQDGDPVYQPDPDFVLSAGDTLVLIGPSGSASGSDVFHFRRRIERASLGDILAFEICAYDFAFVVRHFRHGDRRHTAQVVQYSTNLQEIVHVVGDHDELPAGFQRASDLARERRLD